MAAASVSMYRCSVSQKASFRLDRTLSTPVTSSPRLIGAHRADRIAERNRRWRQDNYDQIYRNLAKRRARKASVPHEPYKRSEIYERDNGTCQICFIAVPYNNFHIDHIIPIVAGGPDTQNNIQVTCPPCNLSKSRKVT